MSQKKTVPSLMKKQFNCILIPAVDGVLAAANGFGGKLFELRAGHGHPLLGWQCMRPVPESQQVCVLGSDLGRLFLSFCNVEAGRDE